MNRRLALRVLVFFVLGGAFLPANGALAQPQICNSWHDDAWLALAYKQEGEWFTTGWWSLPAGDCMALASPEPSYPYYFYYAIDAVGGYWKGDFSFCATPGQFFVVGDSNCRERGYVDQGFAMVDAGSTTSVTVHLTEADHQPPPKKSQRYGSNEAALKALGITALIVGIAFLFGGNSNDDFVSAQERQRREEARRERELQFFQHIVARMQGKTSHPNW